LYDPISPARRKDPKFTGASKAVSWEIFEAITAIEYLNSTQKILWRGQENSNWPLISRLQRHLLKLGYESVDAKTFASFQRKLLVDARNRGIGYTDYGTQSVLATYAEMQHYDIPTHLLDVSEDPLVALWFACQPNFKVHNGKKIEYDGILFAIDASKMETLQTSSNFKNYVKKVEFENEIHKKPVFMYSHLQNKRITAQRAAFIISGVPVRKGTSGIKNYTLGKPKKLIKADLDAIRNVKGRSKGQPRKLPFVAVLIPHESKAWILSKLESGGKRNHEKLFPDYLGMAKAYALVENSQ
jgi:hypothetical protein